MKAHEQALLTSEQMGQADQAAMTGGVPGAELMAAAGLAVARCLERRWKPCRTLVLCGPGNNGGDGFVAARLLAAAGWPVRLMLLGDKERLRGDAAHHAALWEGEVEPLTEAAGLTAVGDWAELAVDALFGAGLCRPLEGIAASVVQAINRRGLPSVAVDMPSGLSGNSGLPLGEVCLQATATVTFFRKKPGHLLLPGRRLCGALELAQIGIAAEVLQEISPAVWENAPSLWQERLRWREPQSHKYDFGHLLIAGGSMMTGASRLAARAALRCGAGLVSLAVPEATRAIYQQGLDSLIVLPVDTAEAFADLLADRRKTALLLGPGLGTDRQARERVEAALDSGRPTLLDADALTCFAAAPQDLAALRRGPLVITPHEGEFVRLFGERSGDRLERARRASAEIGATVVIKGYDSVIATPDGRAAINANAPPNLATAGAGDVLSGIVSALLAQGLPPFEAAAAGVWMHGGTAEGFGPGLIADDLPERLPAVLSILQNNDKVWD
ncbi:NAD(P)H-hydrate dehydratase [Algihabitans albus]|uniref:NAD(P)H-hydrate dehydratase n=1 Tax=Algihabitans albus TaxID=2164067 RepID=UPI000E5D4E47|nr:NAD(P)H-hydrate dehydratase [Algihabitans albus]